MRRTALTIVSTVVALVLLLQFKTHGAGSTTGTLANLGSLTPASRGSSRPTPSFTAPSPHAAPSRHRVTAAPTHHQTHRPTQHPASPHSSSPAAPSRVTATGQTIQTPYGPVQVRVVVTGGRLTDVTAIQLPSDSPHSSEIAAQAVPILRSEALQANSAHIDVVSGATYTSDGYAQSLQSALDRA